MILRNFCLTFYMSFVAKTNVLSQRSLEANFGVEILHLGAGTQQKRKLHNFVFFSFVNEIYNLEVRVPSVTAFSTGGHC